jgi:hypothetical protein
MKQRVIHIGIKQGAKAAVIVLLALLALAFPLMGKCSAAALDQRAGASEVKTQQVIRSQLGTVAGTTAAYDTMMLPLAGGISPTTLIGLLGLACITTGGTVFTILIKKNHTKDN